MLADSCEAAVRSIQDKTEEKIESMVRRITTDRVNSGQFSHCNMTFEELEEQGYIDDLYFKEGILFKIEDRPMSGNSILMDVSKWRSGLGAIGYDDLKVQFKSGNWKITKIGSAWIS